MSGTPVYLPQILVKEDERNVPRAGLAAVLSRTKRRARLETRVCVRTRATERRCFFPLQTSVRDQLSAGGASSRAGPGAHRCPGDGCPGRCAALLDSDTRWAAGPEQRRGWPRAGRAHSSRPCPGPSGAFGAAADEEGSVCEKRGQRAERASALRKTSGIRNRPGPLS